MKYSAIDEFAEKLQRKRNTRTVFNPYINPSAVHNLKEYLYAMYELKPDVLLVGEAPGYKGCRITGIPFSCCQLYEQIDHPFLKKLGPKLKIEADEWENTAAYVWNYLLEKETLPLFWNSFPFHPYRKGNKMSNRAPLKSEIEEGIKYLLDLQQIFDVKIVAGLGRAGQKAALAAFDQTGIDVPYIRHPSYGGKSDFISGMNLLLKKV